MNETVDRYWRTQVAAWTAGHGAESATFWLLDESAKDLYKQLHEAVTAIEHGPSCCAALNALELIPDLAHSLAHQLIELEANKFAPVLVNAHLPEAHAIAAQERDNITEELDAAVAVLIQALNA